MEDGTIDDRINPWGVALFRTIEAADPRTATEQSAYDKWLDQTSEREPPGRPASTPPTA